MKLEVKSWLGVAILLCLGFILGKITASRSVNATPQESRVGRYQLVAGEYEIMVRKFDERHQQDSLPTTGTNRQKTLFRMDTMTGEVEQYILCETIITQDTMTFTYSWEPITGKIKVKM